MRRLKIATESTAQQLVDYLNASNTVSRYALQVNTTTLPTLVTPPDNYGNFADSFAVAKLHALSWINDVITSFNTLPDVYLSFNDQIQSQLSIVAANLQVLKTKPGDPDAPAAIKTAIASLEKETAPGITYLTNLNSWIRGFGNQLQPDADTLKSLCDQMTKALNIDEASVAKLNAVISSLQDLSDNQSELVTLAKVGNGMFSIFLAVVCVGIGVPFSGPGAIIVGLLTGVGSAVLTSFVPIMDPPPFAQSQQDLQDDMNLVNTEIGAMNTIIGQLQITSNQFQNLINMSAAAGVSVQPMLAFWGNLQKDLNELVTDLDSILNDLNNSGSIDQAIQEIQSAITSWNDLEEYMKNIKGISYVVPDKVIMPGSLGNESSTGTKH